MAVSIRAETARTCLLEIDGRERVLAYSITMSRLGAKKQIFHTHIVLKYYVLNSNKCLYYNSVKRLK